MESLSSQCLTLDAVRMFIEASCVFCPEMSCFEIDADGNQYLLNRFSGPKEGAGYDPAADKQLVKDVTDALRNKLLELRIAQESGQDAYEVESSLSAIWQNAKILWSVESDGDSGGAELSARWSSILRWSKNSHKKQVKSDAKLVLATRVCLEERAELLKSSKHRSQKQNNQYKNSYIPPTRMLSNINSLEFWCLAFLNEYFGAKIIICTYLLPHIHKLLCPLECTMGSFGASLSFPLNDQNIFSKHESIDISKKMRNYLHTYDITTTLQEGEIRVGYQPNPALSALSAATPARSKSRSNNGSNSDLLSSSVKSFFFDDDEDDENKVHNFFEASPHSHHTPPLKVESKKRGDYSNSPKTPRSSSSKKKSTSKSVTSKSSGKKSKNSMNKIKSSSGRKSHTLQHYTDESDSSGQDRTDKDQSLNDVSNISSNMSSILDARSPPRRQPHPYPRYSPESTAVTPSTAFTIRRPLHASHAGQYLAKKEAEYEKNALDYIAPVKDERLTVNDLDDNNDLIARNKFASINNIRSDSSVNRDRGDLSRPKHSAEITTKARNSHEKDTKEKAGKSKTSSSEELYDRNGHRIRSNSFSKSQNSSPFVSKIFNFRRKSFTMGDKAMHSSLENEKKENVAFGRSVSSQTSRLSLVTSKTPAPLSKSADSIHQDPEYAQARALFRLRNIKRQENLSKSAAKQEEQLREDRLRHLELKAEILRLRNVKSNLQSSPPSQATTHSVPLSLSASKPDRLSRDRSRSSSDNMRPRALSAGHLQKQSNSQRNISNRYYHIEKQKKIEDDKKETLVEESRRRAAERIRQRREELRIQKEKENAEEQKKKQQRWDKRDEKIISFLERQQEKINDGEQGSNRISQSRSDTVLNKTKELYNTNTYFAGPEEGIKINWDVGHENIENAKREADEVSFLIDSALGVHAEVTTGRVHQHLQKQNHQHQHYNLKKQNSLAPPPAPYSPSNASQDMFCIKVFRAYGLPNVLGGTNPYIYFDWGTLGRASTQAVSNTTSPTFNATLRFKSPSDPGSSLSTALMHSPPLSIIVYSRNESVSDTFIGKIQLDDKDLNSSHPLRVYLQSEDGRTECGILEFQVLLL